MIPSQKIMVPGIIVAAIALLGGCVRYRPEPLPRASDLTSGPMAAGGEGAASVSNPLRLEDAMRRAVANDPDLKAARLKAGVASAQAFAAGLIPDPTLGADLSRSSKLDGYTLGLNEDLLALLTLRPAKAAARAHLRQVDLSIAWSEMQTAERAGDEFIRAVAAERRIRSCDALIAAQGALLRADHAEWRRGNATSEELSAATRALNATESERGRALLAVETSRGTLCRLLGLAADSQLELSVKVAVPGLDHDDFARALSTLADRRLDLRALRAGYESQEARLRQAVLAQFPAVNIGIHRGRSAEEGVNTVGVGVDLVLPLFSRNHGTIAVERATRSALRQEYQARLDRAVDDARMLRQADGELEAQLAALTPRLAFERETVRAVRGQLERGDASWGDLVRAASALQADEADEIDLSQSLQQARLALRFALGLPLVPVTP
ncbi:outer membrane efflux protein [mine drainage metagenome]|uniref:Outer membrane efflux protein n=1 Tax=mine drainage metagenome TaxID=410659 RepID=A0A1J5S015_9ZZZZ